MLAYLRVPVGWFEILKRTINESFFKDDVLGLSAQLAYYFFLALFPAMLFLISLASFFPISNLMDEVVRSLGRVAPPDVLNFLLEQMKSLSNQENGGILTFAFLFTIWSSSGAMSAIINTLNAAYDIEESRPWWKTRLTAILLTIGVALFILVSAALVVAGPQLAERVAAWLHMGPVFEWSWKILQWPLVIAFVITAVALIYYFAPDADQQFVLITPGAALATLLWLLASLGVRFYVTNFGSYNETYGTLAGVMILLLWFYVSGICILIGAEMNAEIEHASPYGKAPGEKVPGQRKKIGVMAMRDHEERVKRGEKPDAAVAAAQPNCPVDEERAPDPSGTRPSEVVVGGLALIPAALAIGARLRQKLSGKRVAG
ncbi:MAG TPA: YihY/virulence factor BrkB family protein [Vicinamibacterales bacterium]|nr:YihY/virulence factor BrkB family protein [Vicinamibacterales bacterium]